MSNNHKRYGKSLNQQEDSSYEGENEMTFKDQQLNCAPKAERKINIKYTDHL